VGSADSRPRYGVARKHDDALRIRQSLYGARDLAIHHVLLGKGSHQPTRVREKVTRRFKSARHLHRFASIHDQVGNLFMHCRYHTNAQQKRALRTQAFETWESVTGTSMLKCLAA
jgi:hypothetical protein